MMLLSAPKYFYITVHVEVLNFMALLGFQVYKIWTDVSKIYYRASLEIFLRQKSFPTAPFVEILY